EEPAPRARTRWLAGVLVGGLLGGAACLGLWAVGVQPPASWRFTAPQEQTVVKPNPSPQPPPVPQRPDPRELLRRGDVTEAVTAFRDAGANDARTAAGHGEALWLKYLGDQRRSGGKISKND